MKQQHLKILRYNTGTDKKAFVQFKDFFDAAIFNATIVAYSGASVADLISMHSRRYIIDPQTHIFQQELSAYTTENKKTHIPAIKKSVTKYLEKMPAALADKILKLHQKPEPELIAQNLDALVECVYAFQTEFAREHLHGYTYAQMDKIRYSIMRLFIYYFSKSVLEHDFAHKDYQAFFGYLKKHRTIEPPTIITTNWDTLIESYCNKYSVDYSYGFLQPYTSDSIKHTAKNYDLLLLKIHGSANWLRCLNCGSISIFEKNHAATSLFEDNRTEKCPVCGHEKTAHGASMQPELITPTMMKSLSNQLYTNLWSSAAQELRDATHIIFVGYSLPIADFEFRYMLQKNVTSSAKIDVILTPNSNPDLVANNLKDLLPSKRYLDAFPKNKVSFYYEGFGPYFSLSK